METATATAGPVTTLIAGMGGQGVVLAGDILAERLLAVDVESGQDLVGVVLFCHALGSLLNFGINRR